MSDRSLSRRQFLVGGSALATFWLAACGTPAAPPAASPSPAATSVPAPATSAPAPTTAPAATPTTAAAVSPTSVSGGAAIPTPSPQPTTLSTTAASTGGNYVVKGQTATPLPQKAEIEVIYWGSPGTARYKNWDTTNQQFQQDHPGVTVKLTPVGSQDIYNQVALIRYKEGNAPEVMWSGGKATDVSNIRQYIESGYIYDLTDAMKQPSYDTPGKSWQETIHPNGLKYCMVNGRVIAIPAELTINVIMQNLTIFEKYNVSTPKTWSELMTAGETLKKNGVAPIALAGVWYPRMPPEFISQRLLGVDQAIKALYGQDTFRNTGWVEVGKMVSDLVKNKFFINGFMGMQQEAQQSLFQGKAAMMFEGSWSVSPDGVPSSVKEGVMAVPGIDNGKGDPTMIFGTANVMNISKKSNNPELGIDWVRLFTSVQIQNARIKTEGILSAILGTDKPDFPASAQVQEMFQNAKQIWQWWYNMDGADPEASKMFSDLAGRLLGQNLTPDQWVDEMDKQIGGHYKQKGPPTIAPGF